MIRESLGYKIIEWSIKKGEDIKKKDLETAIGELTNLKDPIKQQRLMNFLTQKIDIMKEIKHRHRLQQCNNEQACPETNGGLSVNHLDLLSGREFEKFLGWFFEQLGFKTLVTKSTGDHGVDVIIEEGKTKTVIQAKRYQPTSSVGAGAVRDAYAGIKNYDCHKAVAITTSFFTKQAKVEAQKLGVELWDRNRLRIELDKCNIRIEQDKGPPLKAPEKKTDKRVLGEISSNNKDSLKNNQVLKEKIDGEVILLFTTKGEQVGIIEGDDANWFIKLKEKGASFKIRCKSTKRDGTSIKAEAEWYQVK